MVDGKKNMKKSRVVVRGEGSCHVESSGAAPDVVVSPFHQFPPDPPIVREAVRSSGDVRRRVDDEGTEADDESAIISVGGPLSCQLLVDVSQRESLSRRQSGELVSFRRQKMQLILRDYRFVSFQASQYPLTFYRDVTLASCSIR